MIRHARALGASAGTILALPVAVIETPFQAALIALVRASALLTPGPAAAGDAAIPMATVAVRAKEEHRPAIRAKTKPLQQNRFMRRHACRRRGWTTAPFRVSLDLFVSVTFWTRRVTTSGPPPLAR